MASVLSYDLRLKILPAACVDDNPLGQEDPRTAPGKRTAGWSVGFTAKTAGTNLLTDRAYRALNVISDYEQRQKSPATAPARFGNRPARDDMPCAGWSLKRQIRLLGIMLAATISLACVLAIEFVRHSEGAMIADAQHHLERAAQNLRQSYQAAASSLPRDAHTTHATGAEATLRALVSAVLGGFPGVEGGFYDSGHGALLAYAYPTYQGSGPKTDIPPAERGSILKVAEAATSAGSTAELRVEAGHDVILFYALAIERQGAPAEAVWVMRRLVGVRSAYGRLQALGVGLLLVACALASGLAWVLTRRLDRGVATIENALHDLAACLDTPVAKTGIAELDRIGAAVSRLAKALDRNQKRRDELEQRLRHADRLAALGRLVAAVAHEVRNPLASIKLKVALSRNLGEDPQRLAGAFEVIGSEVDRIDRIVARLLSLGKTGKNNTGLTDLRNFLAERVRTYEPRAQAQGARIELAVAKSVDAPMVVDRDRLGQIVDNLIINALDAAPAGKGSVLVEAERSEPHRVVIRVRDNGPGIPTELRERIFEPFVTTKPTGTGLGLFICAQLARAMGGELVNTGDTPTATAKPASSGPRSGANFELVLPC